MKYVSTGYLAKQEGVSTETIRRWIKLGKYDNVKLTSGNNYRIGIPTETKIYHYARVSSQKQKTSISTQLDLLATNANYEYKEVTDIGSGFNFKRNGFRTILEQAIRGIKLKIVVTNQDRLTRTGFEFVEWIVKQSGGEIICLEKTTSKSEFDYDQLISFITSFCNSYYGKRSHRNKKD